MSKENYLLEKLVDRLERIKGNEEAGQPDPVLGP